MPPPSRQPTFDWRSIAALAIAFLAVLVAGVWLGGHPSDLPGFARNAFVADPPPRVVGEAIDRISSDYYRPVSANELDGASITGAVASPGDRFSHYLSP